MATKEELYISISESTYIKGKSDILRSQEDMLHMLKRLYNLKVLARLRNDLKKTLWDLSKSIWSEIDKLQDKMPTSSVPKSLKFKASAAPKTKQKVDYSAKWDIESELQLIQEKLRELNS